MSTAVITGNIGRVDELRETTTGKKVVNFSVAETKRQKNAQSGEWEDGDTIWYDFTAWGRLAENLCATDDNGTPYITGGTHVVVLANYTLKSGFTTKSGEEVPARPHLVANDIAVSMRAFPATSPRRSKGSGNVAAASRPAVKPAAPKKKVAPKISDDDFDNLFDDEDDDFFG